MHDNKAFEPTDIDSIAAADGVTVEIHLSQTNNTFKTDPKLLAVSVKDVYVTYNSVSAESMVFGLNGANLTVAKGTIYGLLGPSGCGKTTLLKCIMGCLKQEAGEILVFGYPPRAPGSGVPGAGVGYMPQDAALHNDLTIEEMLLYFGRLFLMREDVLKDEVDRLIDEMDLPYGNQLIGTLSGGQQRRVSFAGAIIHRPRLLLLDEPTVGVDPILREKIWRLLSSYVQKEKMTVMITTHYIEESKRANVVGFMRKGHILAEDSPLELMRFYGVRTLEEVFYTLCRNQVVHKEYKRKSIKAPKEESSTMIAEVSTDPTEFYKPRYELSPFKIWFRQYRTMTAKYFRQAFRRPEALVAQFVIPTLSVMTFCICIGGTPSGIRLGVVSDDHCDSRNETCFTKELVDTFNPYVFKMISYHDFGDAMKDAKSGYLWGILHMKENFSAGMLERFYMDLDAKDTEGKLLIEQGIAEIHADVTNKILMATIEVTLHHSFEPFANKVLNKMGFNPNWAKLPIEIENTIYGFFQHNDFFGVRDFGVPGLILIVTFSAAYALVVLSLILERRDNMFERHYAIGISTNQILLGHLTVDLVFTFFGLLTLLCLSVFIFEVPCHGSFWAAFSLLFFQSICGMCLGIFIAALSPSVYVAAGLSNGILVFVFIISGILWSINTQPDFIRWASIIQPTAIPVESIRAILVRGFSVTQPMVYQGFLVTFLWIFIFYMIGAGAFKFDSQMERARNIF